MPQPLTARKVIEIKPYADPEAKGWDVFQALVPGAALPGLANDIRAATQGVGRHEASFDHYEELHGKAADRVVQEAGARELV